MSALWFKLKGGSQGISVELAETPLMIAAADQSATLLAFVLPSATCLPGQFPVVLKNKLSGQRLAEVTLVVSLAVQDRPATQAMVHSSGTADED